MKGMLLQRERPLFGSGQLLHSGTGREFYSEGEKGI